MADTINNNKAMNKKIANACRIFEASLRAIKEIYKKTNMYNMPMVSDFALHYNEIINPTDETAVVLDKLYDSLRKTGYYTICEDKNKFIELSNYALENMSNKKTYEIIGMAVPEAVIAAAIAWYFDTGMLMHAECEIVKDKYQLRGDYRSGHITWSMFSDFKEIIVSSTDTGAKKSCSISMNYDVDAENPSDSEKDKYSKAAMQKTWGFEQLSDGTMMLTMYKGKRKAVKIPERIGKCRVSALGDQLFSPVRWKYIRQKRAEMKALESLQSVVIPEGVTTIGAGVFQECVSLTDVVIPDSVTEIGKFAFFDCSSLKNLTIPESIPSIGKSAFNNCENLKDTDGFVIISGVLSGYYGDAEELIIPDGVTRIENEVFVNCTSLRSVRIPEGVTSMGDYAFSGCHNLENINIPDSLTKVGCCTFNGCAKLQDADGFHIVCNTLCGYYGDAEELIIPARVTVIDDYSVGTCENLKKVVMHDEVKQIGWYAFCKCPNLEEISIPDGVTAIEGYTFWYCVNLKQITIPDSVTSIGEFAFARCTSLISITIPGSVADIEISAFLNCENLTIHAPAGSYAEEYAKSNNIPFEAIN